MVANFFGDRWTYLEITGLLWVLVAAAARAFELATTPARELLQAATAAEIRVSGDPPELVDPWAQHQAKYRPVGK